MTSDQRKLLRRELLNAAPWLNEPDLGPRAVDAGTCQRCDVEPRLVPACGPNAPAAVCGRCALDLGDDGWCEGHQLEGRRARAWISTLPQRWGDAVVLWWVATGELKAASLSVDEVLVALTSEDVQQH